MYVCIVFISCHVMYVCLRVFNVCDVGLYVCMCVCMHGMYVMFVLFVKTYVCICLYLCCMLDCMYVCMCVCLYAYMCFVWYACFVCMYLCTYVCMHSVLSCNAM